MVLKIKRKGMRKEEKVGRKGRKKWRGEIEWEKIGRKNRMGKSRKKK
ncbi:MAG: hypothetical protein AB3K77_16640 [Methanosarcinaceae archaeon]